jgi:predicted transposase YbfD/YdcC
MEPSAAHALTTHFAQLPDPRVERTKRHPLLSVITIALCAVIAGADSWDSIAAFGELRAGWFAQFLDLPHGIPTHDTFNRVFAALDPTAFRAAFAAWMEAITGVLPAQVIALDGKTLRGSQDQRLGKQAIHLVSAWATANQLVLAQVKVDDKANEITALPQLLQQLALRGCIVTIDAMGCQRAIATQIVAQQADYVLALKDNQPTLAADVRECFVHVDAAAATAAPPGGGVDHATATDKGHGRLEVRRHTVLSEPAVLAWLQAVHQWPGLAAVGRVEAARRMGAAVSHETRYYLLSRVLPAAAFGAAVRSHWAIENRVHWVLDMTFGEDRSRVRTKHAAENLAVLRHLALNLLRRTPTARPVSLKAKRLAAGWDTGYLLEILQAP